MESWATTRQKATAERGSHTEKSDRENAATLLGVATAVSTVKQGRKRMHLWNILR